MSSGAPSFRSAQDAEDPRELNVSVDRLAVRRGARAWNSGKDDLPMIGRPRPRRRDRD